MRLARLPQLMLGLGLLCLVACASTTVKKDPGPHDRGVRYYRPKPYLFLEPALGKSDELVTMSLQYLPDFAEEYSIHVRAGVGKNTTSFKLQDGWNLTEFNVDVDSKVSENIEAVAKLIEAVPKLRPTAGDGVPKGAVRATNVPLGYYEAVINPGPDGKKRLYGWRYVGFAPFVGCPQQGTGVECADCHQQALYGLVFEKGVMVFKPLAEAAARDVKRSGAAVSPDPTQVPEEVQAVIADYFTTTLGVPLDGSKFTFTVDIPSSTYVARPAITAAQAAALAGTQMTASVADLQKKVSDALTALLKLQPGFTNKDYKIRINFPT